MDDRLIRSEPFAPGPPSAPIRLLFVNTGSYPPTAGRGLGATNITSRCAGTLPRCCCSLGDSVAREAPEPLIPLMPTPPMPPLHAGRIMGVIPDFQTVRDPRAVVIPLTPKQKWGLAFRETVDPFNVASAAMAAGFSQRDNQTPKYGE